MHSKNSFPYFSTLNRPNPGILSMSSRLVASRNDHTHLRSLTAAGGRCPGGPLAPQHRRIRPLVDMPRCELSRSALERASICHCPCPLSSSCPRRTRGRCGLRIHQRKHSPRDVAHTHRRHRCASRHMCIGGGRVGWRRLESDSRLLLPNKGRVALRLTRTDVQGRCGGNILGFLWVCIFYFFLQRQIRRCHSPKNRKKGSSSQIFFTLTCRNKICCGATKSVARATKSVAGRPLNASQKKFVYFCPRFNPVNKIRGPEKGGGRNV